MKRFVVVAVFVGLVIEVVALIRLVRRAADVAQRILIERDDAHRAVRDLAGEVFLFGRAESSIADMEQAATEALQVVHPIPDMPV